MGTARSIGILTILNVVGAALSVVSTAVVVYFFGTTRTVEIYFAAMGLQASVMRLTQTGQISEIFLPVYHRIKNDQGVDRAHGAFSIIVNWMMLVTLALSVVLWFLAPLLIRLRVPGFPESDLVVVTSMFRVLIPVTCIQVLAGLVQTLANAERWFGAAEAMSVISRILIIGTIAVLAVPLGGWALVTSLWVGNVSLFLALVVYVLRKGFRYRFRLHQEGFSAWSVFRKLSATLGYVGATQVYVFALDAGLSLLPQGVFAAFRYALTLCAKTEGVLLRPISIVFFTHFSQAYAKGTKSLRNLSQATLAKGLAICGLAIVAIWVSSRLLLGGLWGPERFGIAELDLASFIVTVLFVLTLVGTLSIVARKTGVSVGLLTPQYIFASVTQLLSAGMVWYLIQAYATNGAIAGMIGARILLALAYMLALLIWRRDLLAVYDLGLFLRWSIAAGVGIAIGKFAAHWTGADILPDRWPMLAAGLGLAAGAMAVTVGMAWVLRIYEVRELFRRMLPLARRLGRSSKAGPDASTDRCPREDES